MNYYTADLHLGHTNIIKFCNRPFANAHEMDRTLIENWNARVRRNDHVYIIGDFAFRNQRPATKYLEELKGKKHLIVGNHDSKWMKEDGVLDHFESVDLMIEINDGKRKILMCHYPLMSWKGKSTFLVYGHIHNNTNDSYWPLLKTYDRALNAGVDINSFQPATFEELVVNNERWREEQNGALLQDVKLSQ
ncbi:MAG: metallophosphoesterase family protein [Coriobacteriia bacterium]|nr:metallophosphoesterase family protein [Coriobacteriia bacterium]